MVRDSPLYAWQPDRLADSFRLRRIVQHSQDPPPKAGSARRLEAWQKATRNERDSAVPMLLQARRRKRPYQTRLISGASLRIRNPTAEIAARTDVNSATSSFSSISSARYIRMETIE
ncbi:hypothetical protein L1887_59920 [Cichorium endivia]|nr:hypothetical protein L1887_59920 [Cichorium endivia]